MQPSLPTRLKRLPTSIFSEVRTFGAYGKLYLGGGEAEIEEAEGHSKHFQ